MNSKSYKTNRLWLQSGGTALGIGLALLIAGGATAWADAGPGADEYSAHISEPTAARPAESSALAVEVLLRGDYYSLLGESAFLGGVAVHLGFEGARIAAGGHLTVAGGATFVGLPMFQIALGPYLEAKVAKRLRLGGAISIGTINAKRATANGFSSVFDLNLISFVTLGIHPDINVDLYRSPQGHALFLLLGGGLDLLYSAHTQPTLSVALGLGFRRGSH